MIQIVMMYPTCSWLFPLVPLERFTVWQCLSDVREGNVYRVEHKNSCASATMRKSRKRMEEASPEETESVEGRKRQNGRPWQSFILPRQSTDWQGRNDSTVCRCPSGEDRGGNTWKLPFTMKLVVWQEVCRLQLGPADSALVCWTTIMAIDQRD